LRRGKKKESRDRGGKIQSKEGTPTQRRRSQWASDCKRRGARTFGGEGKGKSPKKREGGEG